jgi:integrase
MALTDISVRRAKPQEKAYKLSDAKGMYLLVSVAGSKLWRLKYRFAGKEKTLALGIYPERSLAEARVKRDDARKLIYDGVDPGVVRKQDKRDRQLRSENTFEVVAREWHGKQRAKWTERHADYVLRRLSADVFPTLGSRPIAEIDAPELLDVLRKIEARGAVDIAHRAQQTCGQIFRYAAATGRAKYDPSPSLRGALQAADRVRHHAALSAVELPEFLGKLQNYDGDRQTKLALRLLLLTFVRTSELREAGWTEFNEEKSEWRIPAERMKMQREHIVPLSRQALEILRELRSSNGHRHYVFMNVANHEKPMSENTMLYAIYRMGYHSRATGHGFRATASTILNEQGWRPDVIERQLAHMERNKVRAAYHRSEYLAERRQMMQHWADFLDGLDAGANVVVQ